MVRLQRVMAHTKVGGRMQKTKEIFLAERQGRTIVRMHRAGRVGGVTSLQ